MRVAVSGKGGVGKTLVAGGLAAFLAKKGFKVLAIDADPSPNLALTLGLKILGGLEPLAQDEELIRAKTSTGYPGVYHLSFRVDDVIENYAVKTPLGVDLLVMGTVKSAGEGCTCPANAFVRALTGHLMIRKGEAIVMDMGAGLEHLGRGTAKHMDCMLTISEPSIKSLETARKIHELSLELGIKKVFLVGNKISGAKDERTILGFAEEHGMRVMGLIPYDQKVVEAEREGKSPLIEKIGRALEAIEELGKKVIMEVTSPDRKG